MIINLRRVRNFRDIGGYPTQDGRRVRAGLLFRSADLARASRSDIRRMQQLGIGTIVDLRSTGECVRAPASRAVSERFSLTSLPILDMERSPVFAETSRRFRERDFSDFDADALMADANRELVTSWGDQFAELLRVIVDADGAPVLWHCTGGKDRTGFAAAIVLRCLGVDDQTIVDDYLISRDHVVEGPVTVALVRLFRGAQAARMVRALTTVEESWIRAALDAIDTGWGGFDEYRRAVLRLSDADVDRLRAALLEPGTR